MRRPDVPGLTAYHAARLLETRGSDEAAYETLLAELNEFDAQTIIDVLVWMLLVLNKNRPELMLAPIVAEWRRWVEPLIEQEEATWQDALRP